MATKNVRQKIIPPSSFLLLDSGYRYGIRDGKKSGIKISVLDLQHWILTPFLKSK